MELVKAERIVLDQSYSLVDITDPQFECHLCGATMGADQVCDDCAKRDIDPLALIARGV